jgi:hypothetical protein
MYRNTNGNFRSLDMNGINNFRFPVNPNAKDNARLHFTPIWMPDGDYQVQTIISDVWTPAGMLSGYYTTNRVVISGNAYDDWTVGRA